MLDGCLPGVGEVNGGIADCWEGLAGVDAVGAVRADAGSGAVGDLRAAVGVRTGLNRGWGEDREKGMGK